MSIRIGALTDEISLIGITEGVSEDRYGNPIDEEAAPTIVSASVSPLEATEDDLNRETRTSRYKVLVEPTVTIDGLDRVEWRGNSYEVVGEPLVFSTRSGPHHYELTIRNIEG